MSSNSGMTHQKKLKLKHKVDGVKRLLLLPWGNLPSPPQGGDRETREAGRDKRREDTSAEGHQKMKGTNKHPENTSESRKRRRWRRKRRGQMSACYVAAGHMTSQACRAKSACSLNRPQQGATSLLRAAHARQSTWMNTRHMRRSTVFKLMRRLDSGWRLNVYQSNDWKMKIYVKNKWYKINASFEVFSMSSFIIGRT